MNVYKLCEIVNKKLGVIQYLQREQTLHLNVQCAPC